MYYFDPRVLGKILAVVLGRTDDDPRRILTLLTAVLHQLFAIRQTNIALNLNLEWLSFDRCCSFSESGEIRFDLDDFVRRYLNKGGRLAALEEFGEELRRQLEFTEPDPRMRMNGHDFIAILAWYFDKTGLRRRINSDEIGDMLAVTLENEWLVDQPLFREVLRRFGPGKADAASAPRA